MNKEDKNLRRKIIGSIGLGLATIATSPVIGGPPKANKIFSNNELKDPTTKYARPPFKAQIQPWPGLVSKMDPRPDHGETSYKGSGRLVGRKALITGGDSGMGRAAAIAYAREGADVAINYLPAEEEDAKEVIALIKKEGRKAIAIPGDLRDEKFCIKLVEDAAKGLGGLVRERQIPSQRNRVRLHIGAYTGSLGLTPKKVLFPVVYEVGACISLKGFWNRKPSSGYKVIFVLISCGMPTNNPQSSWLSS